MSTFPSLDFVANRGVTLATVGVAIACAGLLPAHSAPQTPARVYYVDSAGGNDANPGTSPAAAWRGLTRVNDAAINPGDTVRFVCGGTWRGSLRPKSGTQGAPIVYTSYGQGEKPLLLGSVPRSQPEDWESVSPGLWATRPPRYHPTGPAHPYGGTWSRHQEHGADVSIATVKDAGGDVVRLTCRKSGTRSNHIQLWGTFPGWEAVGDGTLLEFRFRARCTKGFDSGPVTVRQGGSPWAACGNGNSVSIGPEWRDCVVRFELKQRGVDPRLHLALGGRLPEDSVFEFQPLFLTPVALSGAAPLTVDIGNIIFDHGKACGWKKWSIKELTAPLDYFYDSISCRVFLRGDGNPAERYGSIELAEKRHIVDEGNTHDVVYDGLALRYGAAHGFGGGSTHDLVIRNCDISYIGGGHQHSINGRPVRYGNGIEFWGAAHDNLVEGCRLWEIYDAALTNQGRGPGSKQVNITYRNNIVWHAEYSFEYWNGPETAETRSIRFINNTCIDAGVVWSHAQRPDPNGSHLMFYTNTARSSGIEIRYNVFCRSSNWGSRFSAGWNPLPDIDYNLWYEPDGFLCWFFKEKLPANDVDGYRSKTGFDRHSVFADPGFIDPAAHDFRLAPDSPARRVRPDGGIVGADALWRQTKDAETASSPTRARGF